MPHYQIPPYDIPPVVSDVNFDTESFQPHEKYRELLETYRLSSTDGNLKAIQDFVSEYDFQYFMPTGIETLPDNRVPAPGIRALPQFRFHPVAALNRFRSIPRTGFNALWTIVNLLATSFMSYVYVISDYCRPAGNIDAIFENFNQAVSPVKDVTSQRLNEIMILIFHFLPIVPHPPVNFPDLRFYKWSLVTSADYHAHHSSDMQNESTRYWTHLRDTSQLEDRFDYSKNPRSKGFFFNSLLLRCRRIVHNIKYTGWPIPHDPSESKTSFLQRMLYWTLMNPTVMYVRSQISKITKLKVRPVYNAPMLFLMLEAMLTLGLMAQCRKPDNCILWSYETIRGGMHELHRISTEFNVFMGFDYSRFDQLAPFTIIYHFWATFIPMIIRVDRGYQQSTIYTKDQYAYDFEKKYDNLDKSEPKFQEFAKKSNNLFPKHVVAFSFVIFNILSFIWWWYVFMVFITPDGYGYVRLLAGVPSGIFMTQILDSFVNLFIFVDALLEFGFSIDQIKCFRLFIQGDDNLVFYLGDLTRIFDFYEWYPEYALDRWHMIVSPDKSWITRLRTKIEVLGYTNANGMPHRDVSKLIATLAYPERTILDKNRYPILMSRAIGIAYANAGHDHAVHQLCYHAYLDARKKSNLSASELKEIIIPYQKLGFYEIFSVNIEELFPTLVRNLDRFPTFYEIRDNLSKWHGPHDIYPMWPLQFTDRPDFINPDETPITLYDFMTKINLHIPLHHDVL
ncbi:putative RNA dependent RNA polymerase [Heterobasidion partitivirus P]|uniref:RNA dependent RNA polymerase n=1 Tax=Heterobasidion partitivirus P TaxID=159132 RepID=Q8QY51_9VIRU|nr:putative RNA dependent RNA polymerase [Heterobasidion annosum P-type partitivirus]AAL79540.1 putative RNA dependent RNA polymerase [Heterobasidion annosum P-type partitivirus]